MGSKSHLKVIVNPYAGTGATGRKWPKIQEALSEAGLSFDFTRTEEKLHAVELAKEAALAEYKMVIAVGGDGTLNEVVNGLVESGNAGNTALGIINTGTGCDFARYLGISRNIKETCQNLVNPHIMMADVGLVECRNEGQPVHKYFISTSSLGFDGEVTAFAMKRPRIFNGVTPYFMGMLESLGTYQNKDIQLQLDDNTESIRMCSMVIANAGYYAAGAQVAPEADLNDGLFDVLIIGDINKFELLVTLPKAYLGTHVKDPKVRMEKASKIIIESADQIWIQADGELLGETPATFKILPSALSIAI